MLEALPSPDQPQPISHQSGRVTHGKSKIAQLLDLQAELWTKALDPETSDKDKASLACAWERLENRLGRLRMRPEPKPIDVTAKPRRSQRATGLEDADPSAA